MSKEANEIIEAEIRPFVKEGDWEKPKPGEEHYSTNQVIAAYEVGKTKGMTEAEQLLREKFEANIQKAGTDTRNLVEKLLEYGLHPTSARLRVSSWDLFEVLVTLSEAEYVGERFDDAYDVVNELENASRGDHYCISFRFCPEVDGFDEQKVKSDGFTLLHKSLIK